MTKTRASDKSFEPLRPRVGFIVTNLSRPAERAVAFYNQRGNAEQYIKKSKNAIRWAWSRPRTGRGSLARGAAQ